MFLCTVCSLVACSLLPAFSTLQLSFHFLPTAILPILSSDLFIFFNFFLFVIFWFCNFFIFNFSVLLNLLMLLIIPVMLANLKVTFPCFIFCFPVILGNIFFLLSLPIVIIYPFYFVIYYMLTTILPIYLDIPFLTYFPIVGHIYIYSLFVLICP